MREAEGSGADRKDRMKLFQAAWNKFASDPASLTEFMRTSDRGRRIHYFAKMM
jgi:hypothetical protein